MFEVKLIMPWMDKGDKKNNRIYTEIIDESESTPGMSDQLTRFRGNSQRGLEEILNEYQNLDQFDSSKICKYLKSKKFMLDGIDPEISEDGSLTGIILKIVPDEEMAR